MKIPNRAGIYALLFVMPLFFVSNLIIGRAVTDAVAPATLAFWRWFLAAMMLLPFAWRGLIAHAGTFKSLWRELLWLGVLGMVFCGAGVYLSLRYTTASNAALIYTSSSISIVVMEALFFREKLAGAKLLGTLIGFLGVAVIILHGELSRLLSFQFNIGDIGIALAAFSWAIYSVVLKRKELRALPTLPLFAAITIAGSLTLLPLALYEATQHGLLPHGRNEWIAILALAIFPSVLAFGLYQILVKYAGPSLTGMSLYLLPVYGVALAVLTLGERLYPYHIAGLALVLGGIALATNPFARKPDAA
ncbi:MAG: DMT family transporter [Xanthobacteraceae bacterium]|nr:DMT family transporter [Xanthobacteraceae bacterium]QYK46367.1 MAG: DMT family transporter [Xanthobacteraceae bacterium]